MTETYTQEQLDKLVAAAVEKQKADYEDKLKILGAEHQTALDKLKADHEAALTAASEQHKKELSDMVPREEMEQKLAASIDKATNAAMELLDRRAMIKVIADARVAAGMIKEEEKLAQIERLEKRSAEDLKYELEWAQGWEAAIQAGAAKAVDKYKQTNIPASGATERPKLSWNAVTKEWS